MTATVRRARSAPAVRVVAAAIRREDGKILLSLRPTHAAHGGLWEFPGGKLEPGERPLSGLARELDEELGIQIVAATPLIRIRHRYPEKSVDLAVFEVCAWRGSAHGREGQRIEWVAADRLSDRRFPAANRPVVTALTLPRVAMITGDIAGGEVEFLARLEHCVAAGLALVQLRVRPTGSALVRLARAAVDVCQRHGANLLVNGVTDDVNASGAHGLHLTSARLLRCRTRPLAPSLLLSASCHNLAELRHAERIGVNFVYLSPVLATPSHPAAEGLGWVGLRRLAGQARVPVYALGGMQAADVRTAVRAGCQGVAMLSAVWRSADPAQLLVLSRQAAAAAARPPQ